MSQLAYSYGSSPTNNATLSRKLATRRGNRIKDSPEFSFKEGDEASPKRSTSSPKTSRKTTFDTQPSGQEEYLEEGEEPFILVDHPSEKRPINWCFLCRVQVENKYVQLLFKVCAVVNILSLIFSAPLFDCLSLSNPENYTNLPSLPVNPSEELVHCYNVFVQFSAIAVLDFLLAVFYTLQSFARIEYAIHIYRSKKKSSDSPEGHPQEPPNPNKSLVSFFRLANMILITLVLWYSVAIGIYRTHRVATNRETPTIQGGLYVLLICRMLSILTAIQLLQYLGGLISSFKEILDNILEVLGNFLKNTKRWSQLVVVTAFYLFFIYVFALVGVQWIGGLDSRCIHSLTGNYAIPVTHCFVDDNVTRMGDSRQCFKQEGDHIECRGSADFDPVRIDERDEVYLGQFRTILDAMFGVYEASSWELWIFMWNNAHAGAPRSTVLIAIFYLLLYAFLVIILQQSIFLVVIVESFADLRVESSSDSTRPITNKPAIVLSDPQSGNNELHLTLVKKESSGVFQRNFNKYYFSWWRGLGIETLFIALVILDAIVYCVKHSGMSRDVAEFLRIWQIVVSVVFVLEILGIALVHLFKRQPRLFFEKIYFWCLGIIAIGGLVSAAVYDPGAPLCVPCNLVAVFQAARLPRVLRLPIINTFFKRVFGNGSRFLLVIVTVLLFLAGFAIVAVQVFGYLGTEPQCERTGSEQFSNFFTGFASMFQLVMQEGWTELMGEVMCYRDTWWVFINLMFIILHLFGSLILLNFFVAVILDNLEYDDNTKKQKLEEDLKKQKVEKVPRDLKMFKRFGQKTISGPKISSIEVPNLTEADVRNFYNLGDVTDFPVLYEREQPGLAADTGSIRRQESIISDIDLLTEDTGQLLQTGGSNGYLGVQRILNYLRAFRQHSQAEEESRHAIKRGGVGVQSDATLRGQSEYDEYREKYRLFDSALFCFSPEHKVRRICRKILTYRVSTPESYPGDLPPASSWRQLPRKWARYMLYGTRVVMGALPLFYWVINFLTLVTLATQMYELHNIAGNKPHPKYYWHMDFLFVVVTLTELLLKIVVNGLIINPNGALRSLWGVLDWVILLATLTVMIVYLSVCTSDWNQLVVTFNPILVDEWMQALLFVRALRPLRFMSLVPSMRRVLLDIIEGWRSFILAVIIFFLFIFLFANLGVHLFTGENSPQEFCNDVNVKDKFSCVGEFIVSVGISPQEHIPTANTSVPMLVPRVWYSHRRDFRFDNIGVAMLTLFQVLTTEGWPQVRNLFGGADFIEGSPESWVMSIYTHLFVFIGVNIVLQLFVGIVVNNYNEHKPNHSALLTVSQKRWTDLVERISLTRPIKKPPEPKHWFRLGLYRVFTSIHYRYVTTGAVLLNSVLLWVPWSPDLQSSTRALIAVSIAFSAAFIIELVLKLVALGLNYFNSLRNLYEFLLALLSIAFIVVALVHIQTRMLKLREVADTALILAVFRLFQIHMKYRVFQYLMETVAKTIYRSVALLSVVFFLSLAYAFIGALFFSNVRSGEALDYDLVNFNGILESLWLVIRTSTGEDWFQILWDTLVEEPYCTNSLGNCGNVVIALLWFVSFYIFVSFFLVNVIIAVVLENFSIFYDDDDTEVNRSAVKDFKQNWFYFDKKATGQISSSRVKLFLRMLRVRRFYTYKINENGIKERQPTADLLNDSLLLREMAEELRRDHRTAKREDGTGPVLQELELNRENHSFQNVLKMVAYRTEDITKRLVPHELYVREELEQSVQFDVAEDCIFKWMQKFVKQVIVKQERQRRQTIAQAPKASPFDLSEQHVLWSPPSLDDTDLYQSSDDLQLSDSDDDTMTTSLVLPSLQPLAGLNQASGRSDDEAEMDVSEQDKVLAKSYAKLARLGPPVDPGRRDRWHDWIQMNNEWMEKVETDPDNYFDDQL